MIIWMLWSKIYLIVYHRKQFNAPSNMKLEKSLMNFECHTREIFEVLSYHQEDGSIDHNIFEATIRLGDIIKNLVSSISIVMVSSVSVIFDTGATYSCYYKKGDFVKLKDKMLPRNLKGIEKGLGISGIGIVEYYVRSEIGLMIVLWVQA